MKIFQKVTQNVLENNSIYFKYILINTMKGIIFIDVDYSF